MFPLLSNTDDDSDIKNRASTLSSRSGFTGRFRSTSTTDRRRSSIDIDATVTMRLQDRVEGQTPSTPRDRPNPDACLVPVREGSVSTASQRYFGDLSSSGSRESSTSTSTRTGERSRSGSGSSSRQRNGPVTVESQRQSGCEDRECLGDEVKLVGDESDSEMGEGVEDAAYRRRRILLKEGKRPITNFDAQTSPVSSDSMISARKTRRCRRDADNGLIPINQRDVDSSPLPASTSRSIDDPLARSSPPVYSKSPPSSTIHPHSSSSHSSSTALSLSKTAEHDDTLTSLIVASVTTSSPRSSSTSSSTAAVGAIHHVSSPIPIVAGTLAGLIALLAAVVVTIIVTVKGRRSRARMRSRQGWLAQQQEMSGSGRGGGDDSNRLGGGEGNVSSVGAGGREVSRVRSRSAGGVRSGSGRRSGSTRGRERDTKMTDRSTRRARSTSTSDETVSESEGPDSSFGGAMSFGARGSVARMFDVPGVKIANPASKRSSKKRRSIDDTTADITSLQTTAELGYGPWRHDLHESHRSDPTSIELHTRAHPSRRESRHSFGASSHYPPPTSTYGSISSTSSSYFSPSQPAGYDRTSRTKRAVEHTQPTHTSSPLAVFTHPVHLTDQSRSSTSSSSSPPPPHSPPLALHGLEGGSIPLADVKHPNRPPDPVQSVQNYDFQDLPPAYDTSS